MNVDFFLKFAKFRIGGLVSAEDYADRYNYQMTCFVIILFVALVGVRQYVFTPIQCWIPHEWARSWEEFAENYCWVQDTYYADTQDGPPKSYEERSRLKLSYYQWVPFVMGLQCLLFYFPHVIWKMLSSRVGTNLNSLVRFAGEACTIDQDKRAKMIRHLAQEVHKFMECKRDDYRRHGTYLKIKSSIGHVFPFYLFGKRSGFLLLVFYIICKCLYMINGVGQLFLMQRFLGTNTSYFGATTLIDLVQGRTWEHTGVFPRVTWCDLRRKTIANSQMNSFMCVLPVNMLNEKIYIFLWFWIAFGVLITFCSTISWLVRMCGAKTRKNLVKKYLRILEVITDDDEDLAKVFIQQFLRHDGIFLLWMIARNANDMVAAEVVSEVWKVWLKRREAASKKENEKEDDCDPLMVPIERAGSVSSNRRSSNALNKQPRKSTAGRPPTIPKQPSAPQYGHIV